MNVIDVLEEEISRLTGVVRLSSLDCQDLFRSLSKQGLPTRMWLKEVILDAYPLNNEKLLLIYHDGIYTGFWVNDPYVLSSFYSKFSYPYEQRFGLNPEAVLTEQGFLTCVHNAAKCLVETEDETTILNHLRWVACLLLADILRTSGANNVAKRLYEGFNIEVGHSLEEIDETFLYFWKKHMREKDEDSFSSVMSFNSNIIKVFKTMVECLPVK